MSGYFDALLRSLGRAPTPAARRADGADIVEVETESVRATVPVIRTASVAPMTPDKSTKYHVDVPSAVSTPLADGDQPDTHQAELSMRIGAVPQQAPPAMSAPAAAARISPGHDAIRRALNWVAADPHSAVAPEAVAPPQMDQGTLRQQSGSAAAGEHPRFAHVDGHPIAASNPSLAAPIPAAARAQTTPRIPDERHETAAFQPNRLTSHGQLEERIEVTIGEIHILVDAPAQQTVSRPASHQAAAPLVPTSLERASERSGLTRRALRRL